jgi:hypothetical protein
MYWTGNYEYMDLTAKLDITAKMENANRPVTLTE